MNCCLQFDKVHLCWLGMLLISSFGHTCLKVFCFWDFSFDVRGWSEWSAKCILKGLRGDGGFSFFGGESWVRFSKEMLC